MKCGKQEWNASGEGGVGVERAINIWFQIKWTKEEGDANTSWNDVLGIERKGLKSSCFYQRRESCKDLIKCTKEEGNNNASWNDVLGIDRKGPRIQLVFIKEERAVRILSKTKWAKRKNKNAR